MSPLGPAYGDGFAGVATPGGFLYVEGDERTEGSLRLVPDASGKNMEFQRLHEGVWNDTGIQIAASTVYLGRDMQISAGGEYIRQRVAVEDKSALVPHSEFTEAGGTIAPHTPVLSPKILRYVFQPDDSVDMIGRSFHWDMVAPLPTLWDRLYWKTGSVAATEPVLVAINRGAEHGELIWQRWFPASKFPANTEVEIELLGMLQSAPGGSYHSTVTSEADFSLKGNASGLWWVAVDYHLLTEEELLTDTFVLSNELAIVFDNEGNLARANPVFF